LEFWNLKNKKMKYKKVAKLIDHIEDSGWTLAKNEEFTETLFVGRFNYF